MKISDTQKASIVRVTLALCIGVSISLMYFVNIIAKDYVVFSNPDGPVMNAE